MNEVSAKSERKSKRMTEKRRNEKVKNVKTSKITAPNAPFLVPLPLPISLNHLLTPRPALLRVRYHVRRDPQQPGLGIGPLITTPPGPLPTTVPDWVGDLGLGT